MWLYENNSLPNLSFVVLLLSIFCYDKQSDVYNFALFLE